MKPIPLARPSHGPGELARLEAVLRSGWWTAGPEGEAFESAFAALVEAPHAVAVSSCTAALTLCLHALGIGPGDEVLVPVSTYAATANVVLASGALPVFVDVDPRTACVTPATVEAALGPRRRGLVPVDALGIPCDWTGLASLARHHDLILVEDAACAVGSHHGGRPVGGLGSWPACFSFHPRKLLATGEGGMICTDDGPLAERLRRLRRHGEDRSAARRAGPSARPLHLEPGFNFLMSDFHAAVGSAQLESLPGRIERRRAIARRYGEIFRERPELTLPAPPEGIESWNVQSYQLLLPDGPEKRNALRAHLADHGIASAPGLGALHREPAFAHLPGGPFPGGETVADHGLMLPCFEGMSDGEVDRVAQTVLRGLNRR